MVVSVKKEVEAMREMTVPELREKYAEVFGEPTTSRHKDYLIRRIIWKLQANDEGGLSERSKRRAVELAESSDVRMTPPRERDAKAPHYNTRIKLKNDKRLPMVGSVISRKYRDQQIEVRVLNDGFEYSGEVYKTLSGVAKAVTGSHLNGFAFFRLRRRTRNGKQ